MLLNPSQEVESNCEEDMVDQWTIKTMIIRGVFSFTGISIGLDQLFSPHPVNIVNIFHILIIPIFFYSNYLSLSLDGSVHRLWRMHFRRVCCRVIRCVGIRKRLPIVGGKSCDPLCSPLADTPRKQKPLRKFFCKRTPSVPFSSLFLYRSRQFECCLCPAMRQIWLLFFEHLSSGV